MGVGLRPSQGAAQSVSGLALTSVDAWVLCDIEQIVYFSRFQFSCVDMKTIFTLEMSQ